MDAHYEGLVGNGKSKTSEALFHTARGLEAIGFNPEASMYHVDKHYSPDSEDERMRKKQNTKRKSFLKKWIGGEKDKGQKL